MIFEGLSDKLQGALGKLKSKGKLTEKDVKDAMREVKLALLEADVNFKVVKDFIKKVQERCVGQEVMESLTPAQHVIKIVNEELTSLMGDVQSKVMISSKPPTIIMMVGLQGAGKTTITDYLINSVKYTNLYRLCGTSDSSISGLKKAEEMYIDLIDYIKKLENKSINLLFDRTFFTEENYCRLGLKEYSFTEVYNKLLDEFSKLDFDIYYITLYLSDESLYEKRLQREGKVEPKYAKFNVSNSIKQQNTYLEMSKEIKEKYSSIKTIEIDNSKDIEEVKKILKEFINF